MELESTTGHCAVSAGAPAHIRLRTVAPIGGQDAVELDAVVFGSWDWTRGRTALSFSGIDQHGVAWSGTQDAPR
jgi:arabinan endo-1,5-alpha-L-arabinosidase